MGYRDNFLQVSRALERLERDMKPQVLTMENNMEYAAYLQNKKGYYVFSDEISVSAAYNGVRAASQVRPLTPDIVALALEAAGFDLVRFYRSTTSKMRPPVRKGDGMRAAHPGNWADITGNLASAYGFRVNGGPRKGGTR